MLRSLSNYIQKKIDRKIILPGYENEAVIWAIQDYFSMKGEFYSEDLKTIYDHGYSAADFVCDEEHPEEVVRCTGCGYETDTEGDVYRSDGCCPRCGNPEIVVYQKE